MKPTRLSLAVCASLAGMLAAAPATTLAAFIEDSKASLELRNFYMNKDWRDSDWAGQSYNEAWTQGFIFKYESGFTEGTVGVGVDLHGFAGLKLDSGGGRNTPGTGLLPPRAGADKNPHTSYGHAGATFKAKLSESTLRAGTLIPKLPTVQSHDGRINPVTFSGVHINSKEVDNLTVDLGRLGRAVQRNSTDSQPLFAGIAQGVGVNKRGTKYTRSNPNVSSKFDFAGASYKWWDTGLTTSYHAAKLHDVYKQHILNGVYTYPIADNQSLTADLRFARTKESANSGIDNKAYGALVNYKVGYTSVAAAYQKMSGDTGYAYLGGTDPFLVNFVQARDFASKDEKSWQVRATHDFASIGVPGLSTMVRYIKGKNIYMGPGAKRGKEWERDIDLGYVVQNGPLKNLGMKVRNATVRDNMGRSNDETRVIVSYTLPLL